MKAIQTRYLPPASVRGARIKAWAEGTGSVTISYPHEYSGARVHAEAALALCRKMGWEGELVSGGLPDQSGYVFCFASTERFRIEPARTPEAAR
jgi:hypothetical protein